MEGLAQGLGPGCWWRTLGRHTQARVGDTVHQYQGLAVVIHTMVSHRLGNILLQEMVCILGPSAIFRHGKAFPQATGEWAMSPIISARPGERTPAASRLTPYSLYAYTPWACQAPE